jgi:hypothetical protein
VMLAPDDLLLFDADSEIALGAPEAGA